MKTFYYLSVTSGNHRPKLKSVESKNLDTALVDFAKAQYPSEAFDGPNHVKTFLKLQYKDLVSDKDYYALVSKNGEFVIASNLEAALKRVADPLDESVKTGD